MAGSKSKKTKEDFTSFLLGDDLNESSPDKTVLLSDAKKTPPVNSEHAGISNKENILPNEFKDDATQRTPPSPSLSSNKHSPIEKKSLEAKDKKDLTPSSLNLMKKNLSEILDPSLISVEAALKQSEYFKLSQERVQYLEAKLEEVIAENETLASSALVLQKKHDEVFSKYDQLMQQMKFEKESFKDELVLKERIIKELEKEKYEFKKKNEELNAIMSEKIQQVRVRERELMNRLEILQLEEDAVISNKDEILLDLKKQIDRLHYEIENYKTQSREMNRDLQVQKEQMRKTTKALKLALNILEHEESVDDLKKTGS